MSDIFTSFADRLRALAENDAWPEHDFQEQARAKMAQSPREATNEMLSNLRRTNAGANPKNEGNPRVRAAKSARTTQRLQTIASHAPEYPEYRGVRLGVIHNRTITYISANRVVYRNATIRFDKGVGMWDVRNANGKLVAAFYTHTVKSSFDENNAPVIRQMDKPHWAKDTR